jgi:hypothetical protein
MKKILIGLFIIILLILTGCTDYSKGKVCGTHTESYTSEVKGCDNIDKCTCLHKTWAGLGSCDSCECTKEVSNC